jgi:hypothetical protein
MAFADQVIRPLNSALLFPSYIGRRFPLMLRCISEALDNCLWRRLTVGWTLLTIEYPISNNIISTKSILRDIVLISFCLEE